MTVVVLCKLVDNLGDIGFASRLVRALSELPDAPRLRLIVDDTEIVRRAIARGDNLAPRCADCHGNHDIISVKDKRSPVSAKTAIQSEVDFFPRYLFQGECGPEAV